MTFIIGDSGIMTSFHCLETRLGLVCLEGVLKLSQSFIAGCTVFQITEIKEIIINK